tara:strand:- start:208 stop:1506 length:1299 start_codon:yes stop_codon:yes gene_type:complete
MVTPKIRMIKTKDGYYAVSPVRWDSELQKNRFITDDECAAEALESASAHVIEYFTNEKDATAYTKAQIVPYNKNIAGTAYKQIAGFDKKDQQSIEDHLSGRLAPIRITNKSDFNRYKKFIPATVQNALIKSNFTMPFSIANPYDTGSLDANHGKLNREQELHNANSRYFPGYIPDYNFRGAGNLDMDTMEYTERANVGRTFSYGDDMLQLFRHSHGLTYKGKYDATKPGFTWRNAFAVSTDTDTYLKKANGFIKQMPKFLNMTGSTFTENWKPYGNDKRTPETMQELLYTLLGIGLMESGYNEMNEEEQQLALADLKTRYSILHPMMQNFDMVLRNHGYQHGYVDYLAADDDKKDAFRKRLTEKLRTPEYEISRNNGEAMRKFMIKLTEIPTEQNDRIQKQIQKDGTINTDNLLRTKPTEADITLTNPPLGD